MEFDFGGAIWHWRGPAPFYFITVPDDESELIKADANSITYGWGMIPVDARIGSTTWYTAMFEKDGRYVLPVKVAIRRAEHLDEGDTVDVHIAVRMR